MLLVFADRILGALPPLTFGAQVPHRMAALKLGCGYIEQRPGHREQILCDLLHAVLEISRSILNFHI